MRCLVVLGGADGAITTLRAARRLGLRTICVDQRTDAPALRFADEFLNVSTRDPDALVAALAPRGDVAGVLSPASDVNLPSQFQLARRLGLASGLSAGALRASVDKGYFREVCDRLGQPGPRFTQGGPDEVVRAATGLRFPVMVKPTDSSGGRGVSLCAHPGELAEAVAGARERSPSGVVIAEEHLAGTHHTAEALVVGGRVALVEVGDRVLTPPPHFVTVEHRMPSAVPGLTEHVRLLLDQVCAALDYRWGSLNVDVLVAHSVTHSAMHGAIPGGEGCDAGCDQDGNAGSDQGDGLAGRVVLVELGARLGGNGSAELLGLVHGLDVTETAVRMAIGEHPPVRSRGLAHAAFRVLGAARPGKLVAIHGEAAARALPEVIDLVLAAQPGDHVEPYHRAGAKLGYVMLAAPDPRRLAAAAARVERQLVVEILDTDEVDRDGTAGDAAADAVAADAGAAGTGRPG